MKHYLTILFSEKDKAKREARTANTFIRWEPNNKRWYWEGEEDLPEVLRKYDPRAQKETRLREEQEQEARTKHEEADRISALAIVDDPNSTKTQIEAAITVLKTCNYSAGYDGIEGIYRHNDIQRAKKRLLSPEKLAEEEARSQRAKQAREEKQARDKEEHVRKIQSWEKKKKEEALNKLPLIQEAMKTPEIISAIREKFDVTYQQEIEALSEETEESEDDWNPSSKEIVEIIVGNLGISTLNVNEDGEVEREKDDVLGKQVDLILNLLVYTRHSNPEIREVYKPLLDDWLNELLDEH